MIEIFTPKGMAYAHYTHKHSQYGSLLRVMPGLFVARPSDLAAVVSQSPQFITFFPLGAACKRDIVRVVANEPVPPSAQAFPMFRAGVPSEGGEVQTWWLWDGEREWKVGALSPETAKLPVRGTWNDALLIERIVDGWRDEYAA